jgi:hypothetical protein
VKFLFLAYGEAGEGTQRVRPASAARTVRVRDGQTLVTEGPFAETPEELAGFLVLDCASPDEALERARALGATAVEVRAEYVP